jgi:transcriptional antiterminator RfaH
MNLEIQAGSASMTTSGCWYALHTQSRHERVVAQRLMEQGVTTFLPLVTTVHRWSDRNKKIELPLFSCYVFARIEPNNESRNRVCRTSGVFRIVGTGTEGTPIPDHEIESIRGFLNEQLPWSEYPFLKIGQRVRVRGGSMDGVEGILVARNGENSLVISIRAIQRSLAVRIEGYNVEAI